jgi:hypothetical protein
MPSAHVPGFLPSRCGFRFANAFPSQPLFRLPLALGDLGIGNAARGLCGGMVFAVRDFFERGYPRPEDREPPKHGSPLFRYLVWRLFDSFHLPCGPLRYYSWMAADDHSVMRNTIRREWPHVRRELEFGRPAVLGLIRVHSFNPFRLGENHQVLAYGFEWDKEDGSLTIAIYDPNHPNRDDVTLSLNLRRPAALVSATDECFRGFFWTRYRAPRAGIRLPSDCISHIEAPSEVS